MRYLREQPGGRLKRSGGPQRHRLRAVVHQVMPIEEGFRFGPFVLNSRSRELTRRLRAQAHKVLMELVKRAPDTVSEEELARTVWGPGKQPEGGVKGLVAELRKALGDDADRPRYIETVPLETLHYRFLERVEAVHKEAELVEGTNSGAELVETDTPTGLSLEALEPGRTSVQLDAPPPSTSEPEAISSATIAEKHAQSRRWMLWAGIAAGVVALVYGLRSFRQMPKEITITSPAPEQAVDHQSRVTGRIRERRPVCVAIHPVGGEVFFNHPGVSVHPDLSWSVEATFGKPGPDDIGHRFEIRAVAGCDTTADELTDWPPGAAPSEIVAVKRK